MLYRILLNLCLKGKDIMHYLTALTESKSFKKCRSYYERTFLRQHFFMKIDGLFKNCLCFIDYRLLMLYRILLNLCLEGKDIMHYLTALTESKSFKKCRSYYERPFLHRVFSMKIDGIFKNCSCFIDDRLLMLYRILLNVCIQQEDILHYLTTLTELKSVQKCRSYSRATLSSSTFFYES